MSWAYVQKSLVFLAEEMGVALKRSAFSPNIRDRVDLSCVVADDGGRILAQAEHIPVHLGSFRYGLTSFLSWLDKRGEGLEDGDVYATSDPYITGTHVNDIMLVAPVFSEGRLVAFLSNKAHHVSVGGRTPGGLDPSATSVLEEGLVFEPVRIAEGWRLDVRKVNELSEMVELPKTFRGDLAAQFAALYVGSRRLRELLDKVGRMGFEEAAEKMIEYTNRLARLHLEEVIEEEGRSEAHDYLELPEGEALISAKVGYDGERVVIELQAPEQMPLPFNAVEGVTYSAVATALMFLLRGAVPPNEGFYQLLLVRSPVGSLLNPRPPAPVGFGNLETSSRVFDVSMKAFSRIAPRVVPAAGSGTMMNVVFFGEGWVYYETISGGTGGTPWGPGASAVHSSMTNTLNTPIEVLELEYPLVLEEYDVRRCSGGCGRHKGGDGVVRAYRLIGDAGLVVVGNRFRRGPWGLWGGCDGDRASVIIRHDDGRHHAPEVVWKGVLRRGTLVIVQTPGGGGWGPPSGQRCCCHPCEHGEAGKLSEAV